MDNISNISVKNFPKISVIVACLNEEKYIADCVESLIIQDYLGECDIIITDGGSEDSTVEIIQNLIRKYPNISYYHNVGKNQAYGRNLGVENCKNDYFAYIDAHRTASTSWLSQLWDSYQEISQKDNSIAGVGSIHLDASGTSFSKAQGIAFKSIISGATASHFLNYEKVEKVDHACMCLYNKEIFLKCGAYDVSLPPGEDIEFNHRLNYINGYNLYLNPKAINYYHPRENFKKLFRQQLNYGYWRQIVLDKLLKNSTNAESRKIFSLMRLKTLTPGIFLLTLLLLSILSIFSNFILLISFFIIFLYLFVISTFSIVLGLKNKLNPIMLVIVFFAIHFGYGSGVISYLFGIKKI